MARILEVGWINIESNQAVAVEFKFEPTMVVLTKNGITITQNPTDKDMQEMKEAYQVIVTQGSTNVDLYDTGVCINLIGNRLFFTSKNIANQLTPLPFVSPKNDGWDYGRRTTWSAGGYKLQDDPIDNG